MFYGLYGSYWYGFQEQRIRPALMQVVANDNYQMAIHTSQSFSYPELRDTVFTQVPAANLQELQSGPSWQRDHQNISDINRFIREREPGRPFFSFMFFESTHAPYEFPESAVIRDSYVREVNYLQLNNLTGHIDQLHNRYINAAHHVDAEAGRVLQLLEDEGLLDETIVLFTGDHGEEFMEQGHWGHGHNKVFPEEQIRVPLLLWIPGQKPQQIDYPTSHTQLPATLLPYLGVTSSPFDYSSAPGLFAGQQPYRVVGNYNYLAVVDSEAKITFPYTSNDYFHYQVTDRLDQILPLQQQQRILVDKGQLLDEVAAESSRFILGRTVAQHDQTHPPML
jgi:membrane-anchored protein YejM (alkaline phosphatase superfamily)